MNQIIKNVSGVILAILAIIGYQYAADQGVLSNSGTVPELTGSGSAEITTAENRSVANLKDLNDGIVEIAEKTNPTVVTVTTTQKISAQSNPLFEFFGQPYGGQGERTRRGLGSGVIVSEDGYILTNNHVIENADKVNVRLFNGEEINAEIIGRDPYTDIAVLQVNGQNLPSIEFGNSDKVRVGEFVLAIGSPLNEGLAHTVSFGIVSAKGRSIGLLGENNVAGFENFIQTDAAINPGNSGGALVDLNGRLIGINSAIASRSGGNDGIGFSIPANIAKRIMEDLIDDGEVSRGYLGIYLGGEVDKTLAKALGLSTTRGFIVGEVVEDGPADRAGLKDQDVIVSLNGEPVKDWAAFRTRISTFKPGDEAVLGIIRDGEEKTITVELGEADFARVSSNTGSEESSVEDKIGFTVTDLNADIRRQLEVESSVDGVVVNRIDQGSEAYDRGLRRGDIITQVDRENVDSPNEFYDEIEKVMDAEQEVVLVTVIRSGVRQFIAFELN